jgi:predicted sulfurtransferase
MKRKQLGTKTELRAIMADDNTIELSAPAAADDGNNNNRKNNGKRRLSKRERKNLKKQKMTSSTAAITNTAVAASTSAEEKHEAQATLPQSSAKNAQPTLEEYHANYIPAPSVKIAQETSDSKSLGKWFPKASVIKSSVSYGNDYLAKLEKEKRKLQKNNSNCDESTAAIKEPKASLVLFYQYVNPTWSNAKVDSFLTYLTNIAQTHRTNIGGRIRVSTEGINATVSAASRNNDDDDDVVDAEFEAAQTLRHFTKDLQNFDPEAFADTDFKYIDGLTADRHFKELKLLPVKELVFYGIREGDCATANNIDAVGESGSSTKKKKEVKGGVHLEAKEYHEMLKRNDAVVIDVRNHYEAAIGRFDGQMASEKSDEEAAGGGGATYIDPKMRKSTDFTSWLAEEETKQKLEGKTVMMFCTGGIRCERASAYLNSQIGNKVKGVYQLKGGIERYLKEFPEGGFWRGKNFVFDKREAISAGNINGDGGVIRKDASSSSGKKDEEKMLEWGAECAKCKKPWDRYIGKRKCYTCGVPVLVCDSCMSQSSSMKKKKKGAAEDVESIRCPLCVAEGVTVPAEDVEWTDNGVRGRLRTSSFSEGGGEDSDKKAPADGTAKKTESKAAKSVLKWGGGHAKKKRDQRSWSRRPCQFGADCVRKDCFFYHPERESKSKKET